MRRFSGYLTLAVASFGLLLAACESGGVGDPCIPEDEYRADFAGFDESLVLAGESRSYQCETRFCMVHSFRGRVSCPYGGPAGTCRIPGSTDEVVNVDVTPQLAARRPNDAVYCSCRCGGASKDGNYCECPSGYSCRELVPDLPFGDPEFEGKYCVKDGTQVDNPGALPQTECSAAAQDCGPKDPYNP